MGCVDPAQTRQTAVLLYERLRALARLRMAGERVSHTLDATGLANEAILRLLRCEPDRINDEEHFFALAAEAMRRVLVEHARARARHKRGGTTARHSLGDIDDAIELRSDPAEVLALDESLGALEAEDAQAATIVKLRSFAGMDPGEIAALLNVSRRTVERRWRFAMAKLRVWLSDRASLDASNEFDGK
jgi:RNA polymerase sigma factor (TIGR02999 family)